MSYMPNIIGTWNPLYRESKFGGDPFATPFWKRHPELQEGVEWATKLAIGKVAWRAIVTNPTAFAIVLLVPTIAVTAGVLTVKGVEIVVDKPAAQRLSNWYGLSVNIWNDPYAWHVETDRVVQAAVRNVAADVAEGIVTAPEVAWGHGQDAGGWAYWKFWKSDEAQSAWREVGSGIGGGGSW